MSIEESAEDTCDNCQHPKRMHIETTGEPTNCSGGTCDCSGFNGQGKNVQSVR